MQDETGSAEVEAPGGWKARFTGIDTKIVLLAALIVVCLGIVIWAWHEDRIQDAAQRKLFVDQHKITQTLLSTVITNQSVVIDLIKDSQRASKDDIGEVTYMLTLDQKRRESLRLEMPMSLRRKLNDR